ncbi:MAG: hypothetical protein FWG87_02855 [Defluviitaleaceae bacterium]|nr:hypothetical protein [Defluviitaleaceae bacterium]
MSKKPEKAEIPPEDIHGEDGIASHDSPVSDIRTKTAHKQKVEEFLISKGLSLVFFILFAMLGIYAFDTFFGKDTELSTELIRLLYTALTFVLGFLFGTSRT